MLLQLCFFNVNAYVWYYKSTQDPAIRTTCNIIVQNPQAYGVHEVTEDLIDELIRQEAYDLEDEADSRYNGWADPEIYAKLYAMDKKYGGWGIYYYIWKYYKGGLS